MHNIILRRVIKIFVFIFLFGFIMVMEKTLKVSGLQELGVKNAFTVAQPFYSWVVGFPILIFFFYSKWADKNIWIRSKSENNSWGNSNINPVEKSIKKIFEKNDSCKCGSKIKDDAKFCSECGEEIIRKPKIQLCDCGQEINPNAKFCNNCGLKTSVQPTQNVTEKEVSKVQVDDSISSFKIDSSDEEKNINEDYEMVFAGIITLITIIFIIYIVVSVK